jgi:hypothetical protein
LKKCRSLSTSETSATGTWRTAVAVRVNRSNASSGGESRSDVRLSASRRASFSMTSTSLSFRWKPSLEPGQSLPALHMKTANGKADTRESRRRRGRTRHQQHRSRWIARERDGVMVPKSSVISRPPRRNSEEHTTIAPRRDARSGTVGVRPVPGRGLCDSPCFRRVLPHVAESPRQMPESNTLICLL